MEVNFLIIALESGDFHIALPLLENMTSDQLSQLTLPDKCTPLHYACRHGRVDVAQQLITHFKYSIESKDKKGHTPLHTAAQYGQVSTLKYLLHNLFINEESILSTKNTTLSRSLSSILELKLSDRHRDESGNTPLHTACVHGQLDIVHLLISEIGCDPSDTNNVTIDMYCESLFEQHSNMIEKVWRNRVNCDYKHAMLPTSLAAGGGHLDVLKYLYKEKIRPGSLMPVFTASCEGHLHVVRYLLEKHGCIVSQDKNFILFFACLVGHVDIVHYLITGANLSPVSPAVCSSTGLPATDHDPHCTSILGISCLDVACWGGHLDVVKYLVDTCTCHYTPSNEFTPLDWAATNGRLEIVSYLAIAQNHDLTKESDNDTPLHHAALNGHLEVVRFFIEDMSCDPNCKGEYERTPLHHASEGGHLNIVKFLVETHHCSNPLCLDKNMSTPLHRAAANSQVEVISYFAITQHCNLVIKDKYNDTPLHDASLNGNLDVVKFFIKDLKCDSNHKGRYERTPLHHASESGHLDVVKYFIEEHHCDPLCPDENMQTPFHRAFLVGQSKVAKYLLSTLDHSTLQLYTTILELLIMLLKS